MKTPLTSSEAERLESLGECGVLDMAPERQFDDLVHLAALICDTPMAIITLGDGDHQRLKASIGISATETPTGISFCTQTLTQGLLTEDLLVVPDATLDARFADCSLVTGDPHVRFYAGMPLVTMPGQTFGILCVFDTVPRELNAVQQDALRQLARHIATLLEARRDAGSQSFQQSTLDALTTHIAVLDETGKISAVNKVWRRFAEENAGTALSCGIGENYFEVCNAVEGEGAEAAAGVAAGIQGIMTGRLDSFTQEYPCHNSQAQRWFDVRVTRFEDDGIVHAVVAYENVTARKLEEQQVRSSEANLAVAQEMAHLGSWETAMAGAGELGGSSSRWSDEVYRILGLEPGEVTASYASFREMVHPEDSAEVDRAVSEASRTQTPYDVEHRVVRPDGAIRIVRLRSTVVRDEAGKPVKRVGTMQDVTEQKSVEESLVQSSELLRAVTEGTTDAIFAKDLNGRYLMMNSAGAFFLNRDVSEIIGKTDADLIPSTVAQTFVESDRAVMDTGVVQTQEETGTIGGVTRTYLATKGPLRGRDGQVVGIVGISRDITERKQNEQAQRESQIRYRALAQAAPDDVFIIGPDGKMRYVNDRLADKFGAPSEEIVGRSLAELFPPEVAVANRSYVNRVVWSGEPLYEESCQTFRGHDLWLGTWLVPLRDEAGEITGVMGVSRDISAQKAAEETLRAGEERYRSLFESNPQPMWVYDAETLRFLAVNDAAVMHYGYGRDEFLTMTVDAIRHPDDRAALAELLSTDAAPMGNQGVWRHRKKGGSTINVELSVHGLTFDGRPARFVLAQDVTERVRNERTQAMLAAIVGSSSDAILSESLDGTITSWNAGAGRLFGYTEAEAVGRPITMLFPEDRLDEGPFLLKQLARGEGVEHFETVRLRKDGQPLDISVTLSPIRDSEGKVVGISKIARDITGRKEAQARLRELAEFQRALLENFPNGAVLVLGSDLRFVLAEGRGLETIGLKSDQLVGRTLEEALGPEDASYSLPYYKRVLAGQSVEFERTMAGRTMHVNAVPLFGADGVISNVLAVTHDMTERKEAEEALRRMRDELEVRVEERTFSLARSNEELEAQIQVRQQAEAEVRRAREELQSFLDAMSTLAAKLGLDGTILFANKIAFEATGMTVEEHRVTNFLDGPWWTFDPAVEARVRAAFALAAAGTAVNYDENIFIFGRHLTVNFGLIPIKDAEGNVEYLVAEGRDITALKVTEDALRSAEQMLQLVINQIPQAIFWKDRDSTYLGCNNRLAIDAGLAAVEQVVGMTDYEMPWAELAELYRADDRQVMDSDTAKLNIEEPLVKADGSPAWLRTNKVPLHDSADKVVGVLASYEDITERKQAEAALIEARREADAANLAKSEFLSRMSHELRTPLNAILGFGQILERKGLAARERESIGYIVKSGRHLLDLINEILDISRVEAGKIELSLERIALSDVIPEACAMMRPLAAERSILLLQDPAEIDRGYILADRQRFKQVLINLLSNAIKYNSEGGTVQIHCESLPEGKTSIAVSDTGEGIAPDDLQKLFTPFERLHADGTQVEGTGLGLVLSQRLVTAMDGELGVASIVGRGTTFTITLPRAEPASDPTEKPVEKVVAARHEEGAGRHFTVLCIEDNPSNLRLLEVLFQEHRHIKLLTAPQGSIGLDLARQNEPDLILLDLDLPDIHGSEVLERLRRSAVTRDIPVVVVSADATTTQVERLLAAGARAYLTKPLDVDQFLGVLDEFLYHARATDTAVTEDAVTEDAVTEDAVADGALANDAVADAEAGETVAADTKVAGAPESGGLSP